MMLKFIMLQLALAGLGIIYWYCVRPVLLNQPSIAAEIDKVDEAALSVWSRIRAKIEGLKTIITARFVMIAAAAVDLHDQLLPIFNDSGLDIKPLLPAQWWPYILFAIGALFMWLRHVTNGPPAKP